MIWTYLSHLYSTWKLTYRSALTYSKNYCSVWLLDWLKEDMFSNDTERAFCSELHQACTKTEMALSVAWFRNVVAECSVRRGRERGEGRIFPNHNRCVSRSVCDITRKCLSVRGSVRRMGSLLFSTLAVEALQPKIERLGCSKRTEKQFRGFHMYISSYSLGHRSIRRRLYSRV